MSVSTAESDLRRARAALEDARKKQAAEDKKAADLEKAAASKEQSARRTSSSSLAAMYDRDSESKRDAARKARTKSAEFSAKAAKAQQDVHKAEDKLARAKAAEDKKRADQARREQTRREAEEKRQRQDAARAARWAAQERSAAEQARRAADAQREQQVAALEADLARTQATLDSRPWEHAPERITVLFLSAEPEGVDHLRVDREIRQIQEQVRSSKLRDSIDFEYRPAVRVTDLLHHINDVEPDVVHFSGHGADAGIALHDADDQIRLLTNDEISKVLKAAPKRVKLAVFNSCDSAAQARAAVQHVDAAVGMDESIEDEGARVFAGQLYNSLGFGRSLGLAFDQARLQVELTLGDVSGEPRLLVADGVEVDHLVVVAPGTH